VTVVDPSHPYEAKESRASGVEFSERRAGGEGGIVYPPAVARR